MTVDVVTFGCRLNAYESEVIRNHAESAGLSRTIVFNTCAVTKEAERQARQAIRRARRESPDARIVVTGCSAQVNPQMYGDMPEVSLVLGNDEKMHAKHWSSLDESEPIQVNDIMSVRETASHLIDGLEGQTRAFVQVQNGCDHRCTFCIIPYGRGNSRSVPMGEVVTQVKSLVAGGCKEVVLTGVDISTYGADLPGKPTLGQMCKRLLALVPDLPRLRISSIDAIEIDEELFSLIGDEPRLMPHFHLSLQAGDDMILKRMKRRHLRGDALALIKRIRDLRPDVVFGADFIAGFPTETEDMFANTLKLVEEGNLTYLHVFPYSERPGTPAARMPAVAKPVRKERADRLRALGQQQMETFLRQQIGQTRQVLVEKESIGRSEHFAEIRLHQNVEPGSLVTVHITGVDGNQLTGDVIA